MLPTILAYARICFCSEGQLAEEEAEEEKEEDEEEAEGEAELGFANSTLFKC
jgi:hypothetical protein